MKLLPEADNLKQSRIFASIFYGEVAILASGVIGLTVARPPELRAAFYVIASSVFFLHAFLIWAWGRRYPLIDWIYFAWNITTIAILSLILTHSGLTVRPPSATSAGMYIGHPSTIVAVGALLFTIATRSMGVLWSALSKKKEMRREESKLPAYCFLSAFVVVLIVCTAVIMRATHSHLDLAILLYVLGGGMNGARIFF